MNIGMFYFCVWINLCINFYLIFRLISFKKEVDLISERLSYLEWNFVRELNLK